MCDQLPGGRFKTISIASYIMSRKSHYIEVYRNGKMTLSYPRTLWDALSSSERAQVKKRQAAIAKNMRNSHECDLTKPSVFLV